MRKICLIYANCQSQAIAQYLNRSERFNREYIIHRFFVHNLIEQKTTIPDELLQKADLFIYQPVKDIHGDRSSQAVLAKLPSKCKTISFPSLYFKGYLPQFCKNPHKQVIKPNYPFGVIPHGDSNIIALVEAGKTSNEIIEILSDPEYYNREAVVDNLNKTIDELAKRESSLDVKASSFIRDNYQKRYLFYTQNHPADFVFHYIINQIFDLLDLPQIDFSLSGNNPLQAVLNAFQIPIYPSVIKHLNLQFINTYSVYRHASFSSNQITFARYIQEYIDLHFPNQVNANKFHFESIKLNKQKKYLAAISKLELAIQLKPNNATYYRSLGDIYTKIERYNEAFLSYKKAIELSPTWENSYQALGKLLLTQNRSAKAMQVYQKYLQIDPTSDMTYRNLGDILFQQNKLDLAAESYQKAIALNPVNAFHYRCLADAYKKQQLWQLAIVNYQKAIDLSPRTDYLYANLSNVLVKENRLEEAISICQQGIYLNPKPNQVSGRIYRNLGDAYFKQDRLDLATHAYQQAIALIPDDAFNYRCLGDVFRKQKLWQQAIANYQQAIELSPHTPYLYVNLSDIWLKQNKPESAIKVCQQGIDLNPQRNRQISTKLNSILQSKNKSYANV